MVKVVLRGPVENVLELLAPPRAPRPARLADVMEGLDRHAPYQATPVGSDDAWWFERNKSIEVFVHSTECGTFSCRISLDDLDDYVRRARDLEYKIFMRYKKAKRRRSSTTQGSR